MNIQQFLEQRGEIELHDGSYLDLQQHNAILTNFVLSEVEREVEKEYGDEHPRAQSITRKDISTIINNLRVK